MSKNETVDAIKQICEEKNISYESVLETIEQALSAAYRKDFGEKNQNIKTEFDPETGKIRVFDIKTVVEDLPPPEEIVAAEPAVESPVVESKEGSGEQVKEDKKENKKGKEIKKLSLQRGFFDATQNRSGRENKETKDEDEAEVQSKDSKEEGKGEELEPAVVQETPEAVAVIVEKPKFNPRTDLQISDAKKIKKSYKIGDIIKTELEIPAAFGRMAAQTAKQVIIQRLREAERNVLYQEFKTKEGQVVTGIVQRREGRLVLIDLGATAAIIPPDQQIETENYNSGQRYRVYLSEVRETSKGPEIIASRTHSEIVRQLFSLEVPEISSGAVVIKALAREAGSRSKVAVATDDNSIDPIGSCVGQRGTRIQTIITELGGEKIDIIEYNENVDKFIANALSPAKVVSVDTNTTGKIAVVKVRPDQLSLAIGKAGQNVRLAAKLTGWKIDIIEATVPGGKLDEVKESNEEIEKLSAKGGLASGEEIKELRDEEVEKKEDEEEISKSGNQKTEVKEEEKKGKGKKSKNKEEKKADSTDKKEETDWSANESN